MKLMKLMFVAIVAVLFFGSIKSTARAESSALKKGEGLVAMMNRSGCDRTWLSEVMAENDIPFTALHHLRTGLPVALPNCRGVAPRNVAALSRQIIALEVASAHRQTSREAKETQKKITALTTQLTETAIELEDQKSLVGAAKEENTQLKEDKLELQAQIRKFSEERRGTSLLGFTLGKLLWGACGMILGIAGILVAAKITPYSENVLPKTVKETLMGKEYIFTQSNPYYVTCPIKSCGRSNIPHTGARKHLETAHPELYQSKGDKLPLWKVFGKRTSAPTSLAS